VTNSAGYLVNANGAITMLLQSRSIRRLPVFQSQQKPYEGRAYYLRTLSTTLEPCARDAGTQTLLWYPLRYDKDDQRAWSYQAGQRRVRLAPEFAYDTPGRRRSAARCSSTRSTCSRGAWTASSSS
jgi:hypothetical protein